MNGGFVVTSNGESLVIHKDNKLRLGCHAR